MRARKIRAVYTLDKGAQVSAVTRLTPSSVQLTTTKLSELTDYTLTVQNVKDTAGNTIASASTAVFRTFAFSRGFALWERWDGANDSGNIDTFVNSLAANFRPPDVVGYSTYLGSPRGAGDSYGLRAPGIFKAPANGNYVFFLACDDQGYLYLSPDADPSKKKRIAAQPGYSDYAQWNDPDTTQVRSDQHTGSEWSTPGIITLSAGAEYYIEVVFREGSGGDGCDVFYKLDTDNDPANGTAPNLTGALTGTIVDPASSISQHPQNTAVIENASASFLVQAVGSPTPFFYQWQRATPTGPFADIAGATGSAYTSAPLALTDSGSRYRVVVSNPGLTLTSQVATVTVSPDTFPPGLLSASRSFVSDTVLLVTFSEIMDPPTANLAANYTINNGAIAVSAAALAADGRTVQLTIAPLTSGTPATLSVTGVRDKAGNLIPAASSVAIIYQRGILYVHATAGPNPSDRLVKSRLESQGYYVEFAAAAPADATMAVGKNLVITSSTVSSGDVLAKFKDSPVPVINWEQALQDDYAMTTVTGTTDRGTTGGQVALEIVNASHPLAAGFPTGVVQVVTGPAEFCWGQPNANATPIARLLGTSNYGIYGYDKGALLTDGTPAPERRVNFFFTDNTASLLNETGWKLWDAAVNWAQGITVVTPPKLNKPVLSGVNITITWTGPGVLQQAISLTGSPIDWSDVPGNPSSSYTEPVTSAARKFFRLRPQ